jgi:hypothetical protein
VEADQIALWTRLRQLGLHFRSGTKNLPSMQWQLSGVKLPSFEDSSNDREGLGAVLRHRRENPYFKLT